MRLIQLLTLNLLVCFTKPLTAETRWTKALGEQKRCGMVCARYALDNVVTSKPNTKAESICAALSPDTHSLVVGTQSLAKDTPCLLGNGLQGKTRYCLCASDGEERGQDFTWEDATDKTRCDLSCRNLGPTKYGYAVYAAFNNGSWEHVCQAIDGSIGRVGGDRSECQTYTGQYPKFQCLCTRNFAGDLDPAFNP